MDAAPILVVTGSSGSGKSTVSRLVAAALERSVLLRFDDFSGFVVNGWIEPWRPEAEEQNRALGAAVVAAALEFATGGYTVVVDGHVFPEAVTELAAGFGGREVPLHYAVLRCDLSVCSERLRARDDGASPEREPFEHQHRRFEDLGRYSAHGVDATGAPEDVAEAVVSAFRGGRLDVLGP